MACILKNAVAHTQMLKENLDFLGEIICFLHTPQRWEFLGRASEKLQIDLPYVAKVVYHRWCPAIYSVPQKFVDFYGVYLTALEFFAKYLKYDSSRRTQQKQLLATVKIKIRKRRSLQFVDSIFIWHDFFQVGKSTLRSIRATVFLG